MVFEVLDPTHETEAAVVTTAARLASLEGTTVGFISNGKQGVREFLDVLERELIDRYGVARVVRTTKTRLSAPADPEIIEEAREWHALVAAVGD
jgi:hypothetical protein